MRRLLIVAVLPLMLGGCGLPPAFTAIAYLLDGASLIGTGKTVSDHALSAVAQKDCAMWRVVQGELICQGPGDKGKPSVLALAARVSDYPDEPAPASAVLVAEEPAPQPVAAPVRTPVAALAGQPLKIIQIADISPAAGPAPATADGTVIRPDGDSHWQPVLTAGSARRVPAWPIAAARTAPIGSEIGPQMADATRTPAMDAAMLRAQQRLLHFRGEGVLARPSCHMLPQGCLVQQAALPQN